MVKKHLKIIIANEAKKQLREAFSYISKDSEQNAVKVNVAILNSIKDLIFFPEKYPPDKYKLNNDGKFRAYELYKYRISYHISDEQITIIRVRHVRMNPLQY